MQGGGGCHGDGGTGREEAWQRVAAARGRRKGLKAV